MECDPDLVTAEDIELAINNVGSRGRGSTEFSLGFSLTHDGTVPFSGAVAVDNFNLFDCTAGPPPQSECYQ